MMTGASWWGGVLGSQDNRDVSRGPFLELFTRIIAANSFSPPFFMVVGEYLQYLDLQGFR